MTGSILAIDDHPLNLELLVTLLEGHGYTVRTAHDAPSALQLIQASLPDLILMDLQLPGMDGYDLTRMLKGASATAHIPIVAVTSYAMASDRPKALAAGCDDHVSKPIDTTVFPDVVARYLGGGLRQRRAIGD